MCALSLAFHNKPRHMETDSLQTDKGRVLRTIFDFMQDPEGGLSQITRMQEIMGVLLLKVNGRLDLFVCLFLIKFLFQSRLQEF